MAFGQPSGPPATARQLRELNALVEAAGHTSFKDARGPLGLNQRQAGGRFTQDEAAELISRLEAEVEAAADSGPTGHIPVAPAAAPPAASRRQSLARQLEQVPEDLLVDELRRRGWTVTSP
jgi:hypothetical protein